MKLILASQSRGRKALLSLLNIPFEVMPSTLNEDKIIGKTPLETIKLRAKLKGEEVLRKFQSPNIKVQKKNPATYNLQPTTILSADSGVILGRHLIGKPRDYDDAVRILKTLSGTTHRLVTAVYIYKLSGGNSELRSILDSSLVTFRRLSDSVIKKYLGHSNGKYLRYAGAYALFLCPVCPRPSLAELTSKSSYEELLGKSCRHPRLPNLVGKIEGSLSNVIGLPLERLIPFLKTPSFRHS